MNDVRSLLSYLLLCIVFCAASAAQAQTTCDRTLTPITEPSELAYKERDGRCEGLYVQNISTTGLRIVGYHAGLPRIAANALVLEVNTSAKGKKHLKVSSTRARHYYRMDVEFVEQSLCFLWNLPVTQKLA